MQAIRSGGATQPISIGDGAWGVEVSGNDNGFSVRALARLVDFLGPHVYISSDDAVRQSMAAAVACELCTGFGIPVVLEEFGLSSDFSSRTMPLIITARCCTAAWSLALKAGSPGTIAITTNWRTRIRTGTTRLRCTLASQTVPASLKQRSARLLASRLLSGSSTRTVGSGQTTKWRSSSRSISNARTLIPRPTTEEISEGILGQAYIAAREADLPVAFTREHDGIRAGAKLYLLPSTKLITAPTVRKLLAAAEAGAIVYLSYFAGSSPTQRGSWFPWLNEVFGISHQLRYGLVDTAKGDHVVMSFVEDLGALSAGTELRFHVAGNEGSRAFLPLEPAGAKVLAVDHLGQPALLERRLGAGAMVLCAYPIEHMAASTPNANPEDTWGLYGALAEAAGIVLPLSVTDPRVMIGRLKSAGNEIALVMNMSPQQLEVKLLSSDGSTYSRYDGARAHRSRSLCYHRSRSKS